MIDPVMLNLLVCPLCQGRLQYDKVEKELICRFDKLAYPIRNTVPIMLEEQARQME